MQSQDTQEFNKKNKTSSLNPCIHKEIWSLEAEPHLQPLGCLQVLGWGRSRLGAPTAPSKQVPRAYRRVWAPSWLVVS